MAYTWSKSTANTGLANADGPGMSAAQRLHRQHPTRSSTGARSAIDRTHVFSGSLVLALPKLEDKWSFARNILGDWELSSIVQASTGLSLHDLPGRRARALRERQPGRHGLRRQPAAGPSCGRALHRRATASNETQWFNPAAFTINNHLIGTNGNAGRHICNGPGFFRVDAALYKNFKLGKRRRAAVPGRDVQRLQPDELPVGRRTNVATTWTPQNVAFDTGDPTTATRVISATPAGGFGQLNRAADPRQMQLGIKLIF